MSARFDSKTFNPEAFGRYVESIPNTTKAELARSGAVGTNENARNALSNQTGSLYARVPYFGRISAATSQNNNGATDITATTTTTYDQGFIVASRMDGWVERSFSQNITAGVNFMDHVAQEIANHYKLDVQQGILLSMLKGIFAMTTEGGSVAQNAAKAFVTNHTFDITAGEGDAAMVGPATLNTAIQKACGDNKQVFTLAIMHSVVATNLENQKLLKFLTYTDENGIERDLPLATWNGRLVLVDDGMPVETDDAAGDGSLKYTTYVLGQGALILDDIGDAVPYEMDRTPEKNGGQDTLYVRDRFICGATGISFEKGADITASASNEDLAKGTNWAVINDGVTAIPDKAIPIARIISKG